MIWRILHFFGIHQWGKWTGSKEPRSRSMVDALGGDFVEYQDRRCIICGKIERSWL